MNELQIIRLENTDISGWDFATLRAELQSQLDFYANLVYTDDTIKDVKKDRTTLNKRALGKAPPARRNADHPCADPQREKLEE